MVHSIRVLRGLDLLWSLAQRNVESLSMNRLSLDFTMRFLYFQLGIKAHTHRPIFGESALELADFEL